MVQRCLQWSVSLSLFHRSHVERHRNPQLVEISAHSGAFLDRVLIEDDLVFFAAIHGNQSFAFWECSGYDRSVFV